MSDTSPNLYQYDIINKDNFKKGYDEYMSMLKSNSNLASALNMNEESHNPCVDRLNYCSYLLYIYEIWRSCYIRWL